MKRRWRTSRDNVPGSALYHVLRTGLRRSPTVSSGLLQTTPERQRASPAQPPALAWPSCRRQKPFPPNSRTGLRKRVRGPCRRPRPPAGWHRRPGTRRLPLVWVVGRASLVGHRGNDHRFRRSGPAAGAKDRTAPQRPARRSNDRQRRTRRQTPRALESPRHPQRPKTGADASACPAQERQQRIPSAALCPLPPCQGRMPRRSQRGLRPQAPGAQRCPGDHAPIPAKRCRLF